MAAAAATSHGNAKAGAWLTVVGKGAARGKHGPECASVVGVRRHEAVAGCQGTAVTGAATAHNGGPCVDNLRVMTVNVNGMFTVTPGLEHKSVSTVRFWTRHVSHH